MAEIELPVEATLFILDQDGLVFRADTQDLFSLNTFATFLWICLEENNDRKACIAKACKTFSIDTAKAEEYFDMAIADWQAIGLLGNPTAPEQEPQWDPRKLTNTEGMPALPDRDWDTVFNVELIDCVTSIYLEKKSFLPGVQQILGHLRRAGTQDSEGTESGSVAGGKIHVCQLGENIGVYRDSFPVAIFKNPESIGPTIKSIVLQMSIDACDRQFYFHSGLLSAGDKLIMLPGEQGAGKSTLTTGLMLAGFEYFTDEVALLSPENPAVRPFPIALCSKSSAWELLEPRLPALSELPVYPRLDGKLVRYLPPPGIDLRSPEYDRPLPVSYLVFPKYDPETETALVRISRAEALQRLMVECLAIRSEFNSETVQLLVDWISGVECYALPNNSLDKAIESIKQMVALS